MIPRMPKITTIAHWGCGGIYVKYLLVWFLARDVIYTSRAYAGMLVYICLSVTEVHWHVIFNLGFKFRSNFTAHCGRGEGSSQQHLTLR